MAIQRNTPDPTRPDASAKSSRRSSTSTPVPSNPELFDPLFDAGAIHAKFREVKSIGQDLYGLLIRKPGQIPQSETDLALALFSSKLKVSELEATIELQNAELDLEARAIKECRASVCSIGPTRGASGWLKSLSVIVRDQIKTIAIEMKCRINNTLL
jgi:hypothetical protein